MSSPSPAPPAPAPATCPRCGAQFDCRPGDACWCMAEPYRLPLPGDAADAQCLCPACLRAEAVTSS